MFPPISVLERLKHNAAALASSYPSMAIETLLANPLAHEHNRRFLDDDMNRMFTVQKLSDKTPSDSYESSRAKEISAQLGPKCSWRGEPGDGQVRAL